jgi:hypothetical protein
MLLFFVLLLADPSQSARIQMPPVDECAADAEFAAFRAELLDAIERQDTQALLALIDEEVLASFGSDTGHADFVRLWKLDAPGESEVWHELSEALRLGCATDGTVAVAPALVNKLPRDADVFEAMVAVEPGAPLRAAPEANAAVIETLEWDLLTLGDWDGLSDWVPVTLPDGRSGHMLRTQLRSPIDYRASFEKVNGAWKMTTFVAGD